MSGLGLGHICQSVTHPPRTSTHLLRVHHFSVAIERLPDDNFSRLITFSRETSMKTWEVADITISTIVVDSERRLPFEE